LSLTTIRLLRREGRRAERHDGEEGGDNPRASDGRLWIWPAPCGRERQVMIARGPAPEIDGFGLSRQELRVRRKP